MPHLLRYFITALVLMATNASAVPVIRNEMHMSSRQATTIEAGARVLAGDSSCPASSGNTANANVFVVATLHEIATLTLNSKTAVSPSGLVPTVLAAGTAATVVADVLVCLCVDASVQAGNIPVDAAVKAQAAADITAYAQASTNAGLNALGNLLNSPGLVNLNVNLTPVGSTQCGACAANQYQTCTGGVCGCAKCPSGMTYNSGMGKCVLTPSAANGSKKSQRRRELAGSGASILVRAKQAKRKDIAKRLALKAPTLTS